MLLKYHKMKIVFVLVKYPQEKEVIKDAQFVHKLIALWKCKIWEVASGFIFSLKNNVQNYVRVKQLCIYYILLFNNV